MSLRCFAAVALAATVIASPSAGRIAAQSARGAPANAGVPAAQARQSGSAGVPTKTWTPPRTPWGEPDLQGTYSNRTITPFERPADAAGKETFSAEEIA